MIDIAKCNYCGWELNQLMATKVFVFVFFIPYIYAFLFHDLDIKIELMKHGIG